MEYSEKTVPGSNDPALDPSTAKNEIEIVENVGDQDRGEVTTKMRNRITALYGIRPDEQQAAPRADLEYILDKIAHMTTEEAIDILVEAMEYHKMDPNFPSETMRKISLLVQGEKASGLDGADYDFDLKAEAAIIHYHSPYPEVRAVSVPYDDPSIPCETFRSYLLGLIYMAGATSLNTFFSPRQPSISISTSVLQLFLAPSGMFLAKVLPDWGFTIFGTRYSLNPGPWTYKEQMFATILFNVANGPGQTYYIYLVQLLPQYLDNAWVNFGYEISMAISVQLFGMFAAGIFRRFLILPVQCLFPTCFPTLALNRALLVPEKKEVINGWTLSRYAFFFLCFVGMFLYFWIPNFLFQALHAFNWMCWIAPNNFNLNMITGFYGGLGFNPIATFDWNVAGTNYLVTPFFSAVNQYVARVISGLIIIAMYWGNMYWSAYTPVNSNEAFSNQGQLYNVSQILTNGIIDIDKYKNYGPPFFSGANVFGQGAWFAWYPMTLFYMFITQWTMIRDAFIGLYRGIRYREPASLVHKDAHSRMMSNYREVPEWWFFCLLIVSLALGIAALRGYPTQTPVWVLFAIIGLSFVFILPSAIMLAVANVSLNCGLLLQTLAGVWFPGNPTALIICIAYGSAFDTQSEIYFTNQKLSHYSKIPPTAIFRGQILSVILNCFIFIGFLDWMVNNFEKDSLCEWYSSTHFVCTNAVERFAAAIEYGVFGVRNLCALYPVYPYCFLIGTILGISFGCIQKYSSEIHDMFRRRSSEGMFERLDGSVFKFLRLFKNFNPAVFWAGALNWTGGNNLSYATNGLYLSFVFMYYIKRRYTAWFEKYNYLVEAGFDVGVAVSGIVQTLAFDLETPSISLNWWGNTVSQQNLDYVSYNQKAPLLPVPDVGYFGPAPSDYPMKF